MTLNDDEKANILIVDDSADKRLVLASTLEGLPVQVVQAASGREALRLLLKHDYAVILLDVKMPEMDGYETAKLIRSRKQSKFTPIIFVTAYARDETNVLQGYALGAVDYIFAPVVAEVLRAKVMVFVDLYQTQEIQRHGQVLETMVAQRTASLTAEITERRQAQRRLDYLANHDVLTDMPNRRLYVERLQQALSCAQGRQHGVAVLFIDLDRFKLINDTLGHEAGDRFLRILSGHFLACIREDDVVARFGGDEFAVFLNEVAPEDVPPLAQKFIDAIAEPFVMEGLEFSITCSIGISLFPGDGHDTQTLMKNADTAMYRAKQQGGNGFQFYTLAMSDKNSDRLALENKLRRALKLNQFVLYYQPKIKMENGRISGMEALMRWNDPEDGLILPGAFIPILEEIGMIYEAGRWAMQQALADCRLWQSEGLQPPLVAVNVSASQLQHKDFVATVEQELNRAGNTHRLELEITESMVMQNIEASIAKLQAIRKMGVEVSIDDFGTGYSSLSYLTKLPVSTLKIDLGFVARMVRDQDDLNIVSTIISLAHSLNLKVIAEGVETEEQATLLRQLKCDEMQGYLYSKPLAFSEMGTILRNHPAKLIRTGG